MSFQLTVLIVDDEEQSRSLIKKLITVHFPAFIIDEAPDVKTAMDKIQAKMPHLIFLDVQMRGETGFDLLDKLGDPSCKIIFTTAHSEYAVKAFRYSALDYLMKPLDPEEFIEAVKKASAGIHGPKTESLEQYNYLKEILRETKTIPDKLTIPTLEGYSFIWVRDILYCRAVNNYTAFHLGGGQKMVSSHNLGYYEELLSGKNFFRVHRSFLVNLAHISMYKRGDGGSIIMTDGEEIEVSRNKKDSFLQLFKA